MMSIDFGFLQQEVERLRQGMNPTARRAFDRRLQEIQSGISDYIDQLIENNVQPEESHETPSDMQRSFRSGGFYYVTTADNREGVDHHHLGGDVAHAVPCVWDADHQVLPTRYQWRCSECGEATETPLRMPRTRT